MIPKHVFRPLNSLEALGFCTFNSIKRQDYMYIKMISNKKEPKTVPVPALHRGIVSEPLLGPLSHRFALAKDSLITIFTPTCERPKMRSQC